MTPAQTQLATLIAAQHEEWASDQLAYAHVPLRVDFACAIRHFARDTAARIPSWIVFTILAMPDCMRRTTIAKLIGIDQ